MAKLEHPMAREEYQQLKGIIDFYYWKGILCARAYPKIVHQPGTEAQRKTWQAFSDKWTDLRKLSENDKNGYNRLATGSALSWIDVYTKAYLVGWHLRKRKPTLIYDVSLEVRAGMIRGCARSSEETVLTWVWSRYFLKQGVLPYSWAYEQEGASPPLCHERAKLYEHWEDSYDMQMSIADVEVCADICNVVKGQVYFVSAIVKGVNGESRIFRCGVWRLVG